MITILAILATGLILLLVIRWFPRLKRTLFYTMTVIGPDATHFLVEYQDGCISYEKKLQEKNFEPSSSESILSVFKSRY
jgi:hypothetical protein